MNVFVWWVTTAGAGVAGAAVWQACMPAFDLLNHCNRMLGALSWWWPPHCDSQSKEDPEEMTAVVDFENNKGETPLFFAAEGGKTEVRVVKLLMKQSAD